MHDLFSYLISFFSSIGLIFDPSETSAFHSAGEPFYVSFEGLGIPFFKIDPVAIPIWRGIRFYGIIVTIAIIVAVVIWWIVRYGGMRL